MNLILVNWKSTNPSDPNYQNDCNKRVRFNASYLKNQHGILKLLELVQSLVIFVIYFSVWTCPSTLFTALVSISAFITTLILLIFNLFNLFDSLNCVPWVLMETIYCGICSMLYAVGSVIILSCAILWGYGGLAAGTIFAIGATTCYGVDCFLYHSEWRSQNNQFTQLQNKLFVIDVISTGCKT